jgi:hypothetical protein
MKNLVIGIGGQKRAGKNTMAEYMATNLRHLGYKVGMRSFASPIKEMLQHLFRMEVPIDTFISDDHKQALVEISPTRSLSVRTLLQVIGTDCFRNKIDPNFWVYRALNSIKDSSDDIIIFTDVRFENEVDVIHNMGGMTIYLERMGYEGDVDLHASEMELQRIRGKFTWYLSVPDNDIQALMTASHDMVKIVDENYPTK